MEFNRDQGSATYRIKSYQAGKIRINDQEYHYPILIMPEKLIAPWEVKDFFALTLQDFLDIAALQPQVVLIGKGKAQDVTMISPQLKEPLIEQGIGLEIMSSEAACRTYTLLMAEGRNVAAGIFV